MKKSAKTFICFIIILLLFVILSVVLMLVERSEKEEIHNHVVGRFNEICQYVAENEEHYITISEYEIAKLSEENQSFLIERYGEFQDSRNIIFLKSYDARVSYNSNTNKEEVRYYLKPAPSYHIQVVYSDNCAIAFEDDETQRIISDDIFVVLFGNAK